jgi:hypothetical protein
MSAKRSLKGRRIPSLHRHQPIRPQAFSILRLKPLLLHISRRFAQ